MLLLLKNQTPKPKLSRRASAAVLVASLCFSPFVLASDDGPQEEDFGQENINIEAMSESSLQKAENIDLKKVVEEPLKPAPKPLSKETPAPSDKVEDSFSLDAKEEVRAELESTPKPKKKAKTTSAEKTPKPGILKKIAKELGGETSKAKKDPLILLESEVLPGTSTRLSWSPDVGFMGISAPTAVLVVNGEKPGPTLCLTAAVHGDELNGIEIVRRVLYNTDPKQLSGALIGVPIVNLQAFRSSSRYLPDRRDLNRFFPGNPRGSSASRIAHSFFNEVITHCDKLIDLHTGSFRRTNLPQLRADLGYDEVASLAEKMGAIVVVQSKGAAGSLRRAAVENGIPSVTLEAGAPLELQKTSVEHGVKSVESAIDGLGMLNRRRFWERPDEPVYYQSTWVRAREGGILFSEVELGASVKKGDLLGVVTDPITNQSTKIKAPLEGRVIGMALNQVMFPGFAAYHIGLKASVEEAAQAEPIIVDDNTASADQAAEAKIDAESSADEDIDAEDSENAKAAPKTEVPVEDNVGDVINAEDSE